MPRTIVTPGSIIDEQHPLAQGLAGYWHADATGHGLYLRDLTRGGNHGLLTAGPTWAQGQYGGQWAVSLDGVDDCVDIANSALIKTTSPITVITCVAPAVWHGGANWVKRILWMADDADNGCQLVTGDTSTSSTTNHFLWVVRKSATVYSAPSYRGKVTNQAYHVAATWDLATALIYVDGVAESDVADTAGTSAISATRIGTRGIADSYAFYQGKMRYLMIYNATLLPAQIAALCPLTGGDPACMLWSPLDQVTRLFLGEAGGVKQLAGVLSAVGGGSAAGLAMAPLAGQLAAAGGGAAAGIGLAPLAGALSAVGGGSAAGLPVAPLVGQLSAFGSGSAAGIPVAALEGLLSALGGGLAAGVPVAPLAGELSAVGSGQEAWRFRGAGTSEWDGVYYPYGRWGGKAAYRLDDGHFLYWDDSPLGPTAQCWVLGPSIGSDLSIYCGTSFSELPAMPWFAVDPGDEPAPDIAVFGTSTVAPVAGSLSAAGGGAAAGQIICPLAGSLTGAGGGTAAGVPVAPLAGQLSAVGGGTCAGVGVCPLAGLLEAAGGGAVAGWIVVPLEGNLSAIGSGTAAGQIVCPLTGTLAAVGGGTASGIIVSVGGRVFLIFGGDTIGGHHIIR